MAVRIVGVGKHLPERVLTNFDLEKMVETSDQWIVDRTGIRERRIASDTDTAASLGAEAARMALKTAGLLPSDIDLVICATCTPDGMFPSAASLIQDAIGVNGAGAFDLNAACNGFIAGLATATGFIESGIYNRVLVIGAEVFSRIINWTDRSTCVLFGDGAGAAVVERSPHETPSSYVIKSDGAGGDLLYARGPASSPAQLAEAEGFCLRMDGPEVFKFAVRAMDEVSRQAIDAAGLEIDDIAWIVPHQANQRIITSYAKSLGVPMERVFTNVERYGNTSSASIPIALCEAWEQGRLHPGDNLLFVAVGAGLAWGASVLQWTGIGATSRPADVTSTV